MWVYVCLCQRLVYNRTTRRSSNSPGVQVRAPGFGETKYIEFLDPNKLAGERNTSVMANVNVKRIYGTYFTTALSTVSSWTNSIHDAVSFYRIFPHNGATFGEHGLHPKSDRPRSTVRLAISTQLVTLQVYSLIKSLNLTKCRGNRWRNKVKSLFWVWKPL